MLEPPLVVIIPQHSKFHSYSLLLWLIMNMYTCIAYYSAGYIPDTGQNDESIYLFINQNAHIH